MKTNYQELLNKYYNASTSLEEEQLLMDDTDQLDAIDQQWLNVCQQHQNVAPKKLQEDIWDKIEQQENTKRKFTIKHWMSVAAAVLIVVSVAIMHIAKQRQLDRIQKMALLEEALFTLSSDMQTRKAPVVLYEDELITCYDKK
ncbi:hypothetical protein EMN47_07925 [Prolixibacteraceae bacterium JC049]|nr:hypothetical protein [Prolixibacteraceae bacterium JC049]